MKFPSIPLVFRRHVLITYLIKELLLYFFIAFLFFFMVFFVNQILLMAEDVLKKRVPLMDVVRLMGYSLPFIVAQSAPFATLVGFLMCLGRMMTDNEIMVIRASGKSFLVILVPVLVMGLMISIVSFFVNDYLLPLGTISYNKLYRQILYSDPTIELESNSVKRTEDATLVIGEVTDTMVSDLIFIDMDDRGQMRLIVSGPTEIVNTGEPGILMNLSMDSSTVCIFDLQEQDKYTVMNAGETDMNVFASSFFSDSSSTNPREMTSFDLFKYIKQITEEGTASTLQMNMYRLEFHKKFSLPFASIFFAMLAMPLAIIFGKHNGMAVGLIIGIFLCVAYWAAMIMGQTFGIRQGLDGFWTMWLPDFLVGFAGLLFYLRLAKK
ncbi:MAG: LptF/LptG family permease [Spirochaetaceae bacterium]|nr:LptF/LptG family permease [Spirochaetaceae bacterium]MBQ8561003.1 LptF/LptG family permease [Spirochaetaceae bacterium]